jgi:O-antigen ligase
MTAAPPLVRVSPPSHGLHKSLALFILFVSGLVDLPRAVQVGPVTSQAILTILYFCSGLLLWAVTPVRGSGFGLKIVPLIVFWFWAVTSMAWTTALATGFQNVLVIGTTLVLLLMSASVSSTNPDFAFWLERQLARSVWLAVIPYAATAAWFGPGTNELFSARSFGLFALFGVAIQLSRWRYGQRSGLLWAVCITALIGVSESRLALGIAVVLFPLSQLPTHRAIKAIKTLVVALAVIVTSYGAFFYFDSLRERFLSGDVSVKIGPVVINGSGRAAFWQLTLRSFEESPITGKGAGSASALIDSFWANIQHPHSDYVRILHDYGLVGIALWGTGILFLVMTLRAQWRQAERLSPGLARLQLTALLALVAYALQLTMENALVYIFISAPLALIVGAALGVHRATAKSSSR